MAYVIALLDIRVPEPKAAPAELVEDTVLVSLFTTSTAPLPQLREHAKRHQSIENEEAWARKNKCTKMEAARRASLVDFEVQMMRSRKLAVGVSSSSSYDEEKSTTEGVDIAVDTTDGFPTTDRAGFEKMDPPTY